jgi:hypothetical protein
MDRAGFGSIEREIDDEVRARFPGGVIKQAVLLHYGDDPEVEPGELWVRVLLPAGRPEEYEQIISAFMRDHQAAMGEIPRYLAEKLAPEAFQAGGVPETGTDRPSWSSGGLSGIDPGRCRVPTD